MNRLPLEEYRVLELSCSHPGRCGPDTNSQMTQLKPLAPGKRAPSDVLSSECSYLRLCLYWITLLLVLAACVTNSATRSLK
jgi:hypothetical protein